MAFPDSNFPRDGELSITYISTKEKQYTWDISQYVNYYGLEYPKDVKSDNFTVAGATCNFFISIYYDSGSQCRFGINVHTSNAQFDCVCDTSFRSEDDHALKTIKFAFNCEKSDTHCVANRLLSSREWCDFFFLKKCKKIVCRISMKTSSNKRKRTCSLNEGENIPNSNFLYRLGQDFKQLLVSGEDSDVTFQVGDQQFKAHRLILKARSSVFAAMFHHDMKEKATGVVNVEDCKPSTFSVLLEFLYSGSTEKLSVENMFSAYKAADKYDVQHLKTECIEFIKNDMEEKAIPIMNVENGEPSSLSVFLEFLNCGSTEKLSVKNMFLIYKYCDEYDLEDFKTKCIDFIKQNLSVENFCEVFELLTLQHLESKLLEVITGFFVGNFKKIVFTTKWQALMTENSVEVNEILIKALASDVPDNSTI